MHFRAVAAAQRIHFVRRVDMSRVMHMRECVRVSVTTFMQMCTNNFVLLLILFVVVPVVVYALNAGKRQSRHSTLKQQLSTLTHKLSDTTRNYSCSHICIYVYVHIDRVNVTLWGYPWSCEFIFRIK